MLNLLLAQDELFSCSDISIALDSFGVNHDWRLVINSKDNIKTLFLHIGKGLPSIPVACSVTLKGICSTLQLIPTEETVVKQFQVVSMF